MTGAVADAFLPITTPRLVLRAFLDRDLEEVSWLGPAAARGQVVLYVMELDQPQFDASSRLVSPTRNQDITLQEDGLNMIAGLARGSVVRVVSNPDAAFGRLGLELSAYYLLSFEPQPGDRDGKSHKIKIEVPSHKGVEIRARSEFTVDPPRAVTDEAMLVEALRAPLLLAGEEASERARNFGIPVVAIPIGGEGAPDLEDALVVAGEHLHEARHHVLPVVEHAPREGALRELLVRLDHPVDEPDVALVDERLELARVAAHAAAVARRLDRGHGNGRHDAEDDDHHHQLHHRDAAFGRSFRHRKYSVRWFDFG